MAAPRLRRRTLIAGCSLAVVALTAVVAVPAFAHDSGTGTKTKSSKTSKSSAGLLKTDVGTVISGALTGTSPCEKSGPPASDGQVGRDAEGHGVRGPLLQKPLTEAERVALSAEQAQARAVAEQYPTVAVAEAAGYRKSTPYVPCIGAHYTKVSLVGKFDPAAPSELLFDGTNPDSKVVGLSYLVMHDGAPDGFAGPNDIWHQHNANGGLCIGAGGVVVGNEATSPKACAARGGHKVVLNGMWMVHDWVVPGWECSWGVFAGECPELGGRVGGTVFDAPDPKVVAGAKAKRKS